MRVILTEDEILMAIEDFVLDTVKVPDDIRVDIDLKATRGSTGYTAEIDLVHFTSPADGSDRSVDTRIEPSDTAVNEGLGIVDKIEAAKSAGLAPRRRGRPAGSKNKTDADRTDSPQTPAQAVEEHPAHQDAVQEPTPSAEAESALETMTETADTPEVAEPVQEDPNISATNEQMVAQAEGNPPFTLPEATPAPTAPATDMSTQTKKTGLFANLSDAGDPEPEPEKSILADEPEPNSEAALAAEAAATEPAEGNGSGGGSAPQATDEDEDVDYTPTPETASLSSADAEGTSNDAPPPRTRSLFGDLSKPTN